MSEFHGCILSPEKSIGRGADPQSNKGIGKQKDQEEVFLWHEQWDSIATTTGWELSVGINSEKMHAAEGGRKTRDKVRTGCGGQSQKLSQKSRPNSFCSFTLVTRPALALILSPYPVLSGLRQAHFLSTNAPLCRPNCWH